MTNIIPEIPLTSPPSVKPKLTFLGHSTLIIEMDGVRILTDPLLRTSVSFLRRYSPPLTNTAYAGNFDAVLISHLHYDHLDLRSLSLLGKGIPLITPYGAKAILAAAGFRAVREVHVGEELLIGKVAIRSVFADHDPGRHPFSDPAEASLGFVIEGSASVYFPGDTRLFPTMINVLEGLERGLDLGLMPVWGWGYTLGHKGDHMGPLQAAQACAMLKPKMAVPIHWGTYAPLGAKWLKPSYLFFPPVEFAAYTKQYAPGVEVKTLMPGEAMEF
jgi:L-ascorbate metabolism protein UlaG (beta-lactamase superfamily)